MSEATGVGIGVGLAIGGILLLGAGYTAYKNQGPVTASLGTFFFAITNFDAEKKCFTEMSLFCNIKF
jgi:hypothetical protein